MHFRRLWILFAAGVITVAWLEYGESRVSAAPAESVVSIQEVPGGGRLSSIAVGHEYRQDDLPSVAVAPDGSVWAAWLSFVGDRDDVALRHYRNGVWGNLIWVPGTSGDSWLPQVAVDSSNRVWAVWSQNVNGNWDLYGRRLDPERQEWSAMERLTSNLLPDINPRLVSNGKGQFALVWQGFRGRNSNIFLKTFDGEKWSSEIRVTNRAANDWEPAAAIDSTGTVWVAYDSYKNGNYDVLLTQVRNGQAVAPEITLAATPAFEARAAVTVDASDRVWAAWEQGAPNWGKDQGYVIRGRAPGVGLGAPREVKIRCYSNGRWQEPAAAPGFQGNSYQPLLIPDGRGSVWVAAMLARQPPQPAGEGQRPGPPRQPPQPAGEGRRPGPPRQGYYEYWMAHLTGNGWSDPFPLPNSKGRSSTRINAALAADSGLWLAWPTDNREESFYGRPQRQQVYAGMLSGTPGSASPALREPVEQPVQAKDGHRNEAGDVRALRAYSIELGGKKLRLLRGDFHRHTELSWDVGALRDGNLQDFYRYMIDVADLDFGASTDHQGGTWPYWWWYTQKMTDMYNAPGRYTAIFGYERSATWPFGHHNVFFARRTESRVTPFYTRDGVPGFLLRMAGQQEPLPPGAPPERARMGANFRHQGDEPHGGTGALVQNDTRLLYEELRPRNGLTIPHTTATRMGTDWSDNDPRVEPVVEIFQGCRTNYEQAGAPLSVDPAKDTQQVTSSGYELKGMVSEAWTKGYKLGIIASSDHSATHISYAMVYTEDPSRQGVLNAIRKRHTYGAMDNILMDVRMGEYFMGDEFALSAPLPIRIKVRGTRAIAQLDVIKDNKVVYSIQPKRQDVELEYTDKGGVAGRHFYYVRVQQDDQMLAWSSPFFINYK